MSDEPDLTWYEVVVEFALDHSDPACPSREDVFDAFVDATPKGLVDASHSMGPADGEAVRATTVPAPTPDEDGWFRVDGWKVRHLNSVVEMEDPYGCAPLFMPDQAEFLGAALIAAAQDARRLAAGNARSEA